MPWTYRLRFRTAKHFNTEDERLLLAQVEPAAIAIRAADGSLKTSEWLIICVSGHLSREDAIREAARTKSALLLAATERFLGFDCGPDRVTAGLFRGIKEAIREQNGMVVRDNVHGVDVFEGGDEVHIFNVSARTQVLVSPPHFVTAFSKHWNANQPILTRHRLSLELINLTFFETSAAAQLILWTTAIEILAPTRDRSNNVRDALSSLIETLKKMDLNEADKQVVEQALLRAKTTSIAEACREKISNRLGQNQVTVFNAIYRARSQLVHSGQTEENVHEMALSARELASALVLTEIAVAQTPPG